MAFFDDLGKKISLAGQSAVQKTKDMTAIAKLNGQISDEEKKLNNAYLQLGKLYVEKHAADCEEEFKALIAGIQLTQSTIAGYKQQIQDIKGVLRCEKCGAEVAVGAGFCSTCGNPMPAKEPAVPVNPNLIPCIGCGTMVDKTMRFCTACGKPIAESLAAVTPTPVAQPAPAPANVCAQCGTQIPTGYAFCTQCGTPVGATPVAQPAPVAQPVSAPVEQSIPASGTLCTGCGAIVPPGYAFCTGCLTPVNAAPAQEPAPMAQSAPMAEPIPAPVEPFAQPSVEETPAPVAEQPVPPAVRICIQCGAGIPDGYAFCTQCGTPVAKVQPAPAPTPAGTICSGCGAQVPSGFAFCTQCGTKVN